MGTGVALVTPFNSDLSIDYAALQNIIDFNIENGVNYLVVQGTTGESPVLTTEEQLLLFEKVVAMVNKRVPLVAGIGGNNTLQVLKRMQSFPFLNDYVTFLSVTPYYNKPSQAALIAHYSTLAAGTPLPIILYNVPGRTGVNMLPATTLALAHQFKKIVAIKEASGSMAASFELVKNKPAGFMVLSGDDDLAMPQMLMGFDGVISVAAQCFPKQFCSMIQFASKGEVQLARQLHYKLIDGINLLFAEGNPAGVKCALHSLNLCQNYLRLPLIPASTTLNSNIQRFIAGL
jgi:4-hydroxy-tetrahydrodipicolinate synthase